MQHLDLRGLCGQPIGDLPGPVRGVVVDDQDPIAARDRALELGGRGADDRLRCSPPRCRWGSRPRPACASVRERSGSAPAHVPRSPGYAERRSCACCATAGTRHHGPGQIHANAVPDYKTTPGRPAFLGRLIPVRRRSMDRRTPSAPVGRVGGPLRCIGLAVRRSLCCRARGGGVAAAVIAGPQPAGGGSRAVAPHDSRAASGPSRWPERPRSAPARGERRRSTARSRYTPYVRIAGAQHKEIALTFDDGPGPYTPQILSILDREHVPATFFEVGMLEHYFHASTAADRRRRLPDRRPHRDPRSRCRSSRPASQRTQLLRQIRRDRALRRAVPAPVPPALRAVERNARSRCCTSTGC